MLPLKDHKYYLGPDHTDPNVAVRPQSTTQLGDRLAFWYFFESKKGESPHVYRNGETGGSGYVSG